MNHRRMLYFFGIVCTTASFLLCVPALIAATPQQQQPEATYTILHQFTDGADGGSPTNGLTIDHAGSFYGSAGGRVIFRLQRQDDGWLLTPIYRDTLWLDGSHVNGELTIGRGGKIFGATLYGGNSCSDLGGCGSIFHLQPRATICPVIVCSWTATDIWDADPTGDLTVEPNSRMIEDASGNLFGTMKYGETGLGEIFELERDGQNYNMQLRYSFTGGADGAHPSTGLVADAAGNLYGTAVDGGAGSGTVFELSNVGGEWVESTIYTFQAGVDGAYPGGLIIDAAGNLYGNTGGAGPNGGATIFKLAHAQDGWQLTVLYELFGGAPSGTIAGDANGNLFGATYGGGSFFLGTVFELIRTDNGYTFRQLHTFHGPDGANPLGALVVDAEGNLYGTTERGGTGCSLGDCGVVWEITP